MKLAIFSKFRNRRRTTDRVLMDEEEEGTN